MNRTTLALKHVLPNSGSLKGYLKIKSPKLKLKMFQNQTIPRDRWFYSLLYILGATFTTYFTQKGGKNHVKFGEKQGFLILEPDPNKRLRQLSTNINNYVT